MQMHPGLGEYGFPDLGEGDAVGPWASPYLPRAFTTRLRVASTCECNCLESILVEHQGPTWEPGTHSSTYSPPLNSSGP